LVFTRRYLGFEVQERLGSTTRPSRRNSGAQNVVLVGTSQGQCEAFARNTNTLPDKSQMVVHRRLAGNHQLRQRTVNRDTSLRDNSATP
jgi:hypothetical protein